MFSSNMQKVTDKLTKKFGDTVTLLEVVQGVYDTQTGLTADIITPHVVKGVVEAYTSNELVAGLVGVDDLKVMVYASTFTITKEWKVNYRGMSWEIINLTDLSTQDTKIFYELQIRSK